MSGTLVLVGAPAAGKSTVGRLVADRLGADFLDTDEALADTVGMSLPEAWASLPAQAIAASQSAISRAALARDGVVALGSAAVEQADVREALAGLDVVWLRVSITHATRRLGMASLGMEALTELRRRMDAMLAEREHWYEEVSTAQVDTDRLDAEGAAARIVELWRGER